MRNMAPNTIHWMGAATALCITILGASHPGIARAQDAPESDEGPTKGTLAEDSASASREAPAQIKSTKHSVSAGSDVVADGKSYPVENGSVEIPPAARDRRVRLRSAFGSILDVKYERPGEGFPQNLSPDWVEAVVQAGVSVVPRRLKRLTASQNHARAELQARVLLGDFALLVGSGVSGNSASHGGDDVTRRFLEHRFVVGVLAGLAPFASALGGPFRIHAEAAPLLSFRRTKLTLVDEPEDYVMRSSWRTSFGGRLGLRWQAVGGLWVHTTYEAYRDTTHYKEIAFEETALTQGFLVGVGYAL